MTRTRRDVFLGLDIGTSGVKAALVGERGAGRASAPPPHRRHTRPTLLWLRTHEPERFARLAKVVLAKDYIRYRLTDSLATEPSDASGTLMFDTAHRRWSTEIMGALGLSPSLLPDLGESSEVLGRLSAAAARLTGLAAGTPVVGGGPDNAS